MVNKKTKTFVFILNIQHLLSVTQLFTQTLFYFIFNNSEGSLYSHFKGTFQLTSKIQNTGLEHIIPKLIDNKI